MPLRSDGESDDRDASEAGGEVDSDGGADGHYRIRLKFPFLFMLALSTISSYKDDHLPEMEGLGAPGPQTLPLVKITKFQKKTN